MRSLLGYSTVAACSVWWLSLLETPLQGWPPPVFVRPPARMTSSRAWITLSEQLSRMARCPVLLCSAFMPSFVADLPVGSVTMDTSWQRDSAQLFTCLTTWTRCGSPSKTHLSHVWLIMPFWVKKKKTNWNFLFLNVEIQKGCISSSFAFHGGFCTVVLPKLTNARQIYAWNG